MKRFQEGQYSAPDTAGIEVVELFDVNLDMAVKESMRPLLTASEVRHELPDPQELADLALFQGVQPNDFKILIKQGETIVVAPGHTLLSAGQLNSRLYFVLEGQLRLFADGTEKDLTGIVDIGQFAGLRSAIEQNPSNESIVAGEHSRVFVIDLLTLKQLTDQSHAAAQNFAQLLAQFICGESHIAVGASAASSLQKREGFVDGLSGLHNHRWLEKMLPRHMNRCMMDQSSLALIMFEIDKLEEIKTTHGVEIWEKLIHLVGQTMLDNGRATDLMVRDNGERFVVLLPNSNLNDARLLARRLSDVIGKTVVVPPNRRPLPLITLSVGIVELKGQLTENAFLARAAHLVQQAKKVGGNWIAE